MTHSDDEVNEHIEFGSRVVENLIHGDLFDVPLSEIDSLAHHGVKGMHWGVRRNRDSSDGSSSSGSISTKDSVSKNAYSSALKNLNSKPLTKKEIAANLAANEKKFQQKFDGDDKTSKQSFASRHKKGLIALGIGTAIIGGALVGASIADKRAIESIGAYAGKEIPNDVFAKHVAFSKMKSWGPYHGYVQPSSFERPAYSLPAGHTFHRISRVEETAFKGATYATHNTEDFHRYVSQFRGELTASGAKSLHHITFQATEEIKIPDLKTVLDTLKETLDGAASTSHTPEQVLEKYQQLSGGSWGGKQGKSLIKALQDKGYHALVDEMDAGVIGETPIVLFGNGLGAKASEPLTNELIQQAESSLVELTNRKVGETL